MPTLAVLLGLVFLSGVLGAPPSIRDVKRLSDEEMKQLMEKHTFELSPEQRHELLAVTTGLNPQAKKQLRGLIDQLEGSQPVSLQDLSPFWDVDVKGSLDVFRHLSRHPDVSLRFFALLIRIKSAEMPAAEELKRLTLEDTLSVEDKRILKSWCHAIGLDAVQDSARDMFEHIQMTVGGRDQQPKIGDKAPAFEIKEISGQVVKLADLRGKPVLLHFWAAWCRPCVFELDGLQRYLHGMLEDREVVVIGVSLDDNEELFRSAIQKHKLNWIHNFEGKGWGTKLGRLYKVTFVPQDFVIDQRGTIASRDYRDLHQTLRKRTQ